MLSRRALIMTGSASILVLSTGSCMLASSRRMDAVREPWRQAAEGFGDARLNALAYAILAPNPHNRQPWQVRLDGTDAMTIYCDMERLLPETDPPNRQITIGFGAFLELLRQAAAEQGYRAEITPFPEGEPQPVLDERPIAFVRLVRDASVTPDPLFGHALARRTNREKFDLEKPLTADTASALVSLSQDGSDTPVNITSAPDTVSKLRDISLRAWHIETGTPRTHHESTRLMRVGSAAIKANPDGVSLDGAVMEAMKLAGILSPEKLETPGTLAYKETQSFYDGLIESAPTFSWLTTPGNSRIEQLQTGARWVRLHLAATQLGVAMHPLSQVLQEFPEMASCYDEIHDLLGISAPARIQGLFRLGYASQPAASPRWPLMSRMII